MTRLEQAFWNAWLRHKPRNWPDPLKQFRFAKCFGRQYAADFAWLGPKLIVECQGGTWGKKKGGHHTGSGIAKDYARTNFAQRLGWLVLQYDAKALSGSRLDATVKEVIEIIVERIEQRRPK